MASYEPNLEGAITVLVDLMTANGFALTRQPYAPNYRGLVDAVAYGALYEILGLGRSDDGIAKPSRYEVTLFPP